MSTIRDWYEIIPLKPIYIEIVYKMRKNLDNFKFLVFPTPILGNKKSKTQIQGSAVTF